MIFFWRLMYLLIEPCTLCSVTYVLYVIDYTLVVEKKRKNVNSPWSSTLFFLPQLYFLGGVLNFWAEMWKVYILFGWWWCLLKTKVKKYEKTAMFQQNSIQTPPWPIDELSLRVKYSHNTNKIQSGSPMKLIIKCFVKWVPLCISKI